MRQLSTAAQPARGDSCPERDRRRRAIRDPPQQNEKRQRSDADQRRFEHQPDPEQAHQQAEPELQPGADRLRNEPSETLDRPGRAEHQQDTDEHHPGCGHFAGPQPARQYHGRHGLHRLNRHREAVEHPGSDQEDGKAEQHTRRRPARRQ